MLRYALAGRAGMLGSELRRVLAATGEFTEVCLPLTPDVPAWTDPFTGAREPDFATPGYLAWLRDVRPDVVINAAAVVGSHRVLLVGEELAARSNHTAAARLAEVANALPGTRLVYFATEAEFDPADYDRVRPLHPLRTPARPRTAYGRVKLAGRRATQMAMAADRLLVVYPIFAFGSPWDSKSVLMALLRAGARAPGYTAGPLLVQLDPQRVKELSWQEDVARHAAGLLAAGAAGVFASASGAAVPFHAHVEALLGLPGYEAPDLDIQPGLDYKGDLVLDPAFREASWAAAGLFPTPAAEFLRREWERLRARLAAPPAGEPLYFPHTWAGLEAALRAAVLRRPVEGSPAPLTPGEEAKP